MQHFGHLGTIQLSLVAQSSLGGKLIAISGPCFKPNSTITCFFGDVRTEGVIQSSLRAYCVPPNLNQYGIVTLRVSVDNGVEQNEYSTSFTLCKSLNSTKKLYWHTYTYLAPLDNLTHATVSLSHMYVHSKGIHACFVVIAYCSVPRRA